MSGNTPDAESGQPSIGKAALFGLCPRCGDQSLFNGIAEFSPKCSKCKLDFAQFNVGDGPAGFLTLIIGAFIVGLALWLEVTLSPPFWVHALLWIPLTILCVLGGLRAAKSALLYSEYSQNAGEGTPKK